MHRRPNIIGKQFLVFEFLMLLIKPSICKPHIILCVFVFRILRLIGLEMIIDSSISWIKGHLSCTASKISLNSMLVDGSSSEEPRMLASHIFSRTFISSLIVFFCLFDNVFVGISHFNFWISSWYIFKRKETCLSLVWDYLAYCANITEISPPWL